MWNGGEFAAMWSSFAVAAFAGAVFLFAPGYFLLRAVKMPWWASLACGPAISTIGYSLLCVLYGEIGVFCNWAVVFCPIFLVSLCVFAVSRLVRKDNRAGWDNASAATMVLYVTVGIAVTMGVYLFQLGSADAFIQSWDNVHHLGAVRAFVDSGRWSSFATTLYLGQDAAVDPFVEAPFYPSAWHMLAAMISSLTGVSAPIAINVTNFVLIAVAFPIGMYSFLKIVFGDDTWAIVAGALFVLANASCPWMLLTWGPLYPNVMANCMLPGVMGAFVLLLKDGASSRERITAGAVILVSVASFAFIQPNGVFSAVVLLAPYLVVQSYSLAKHSAYAARRSASFARGLGLACALGAIIVIVVFWVVAFNAPFTQKVVQYRWPCDSTLEVALMDVVTQRFHVAGLSVGCALFLGVGIIAAFVRRRHRWLVFSWLLSCLIYVVCVSVDGYRHQFFAGFWYTDVPRIASFAALAAIPLQALGLGSIMRLASEPFKRNGILSVVSAVLMAVIAGILLYAPIGETYTSEEGERHFSDASALGVEAAHIAYEYSFDDPRVYDEVEREFVREVLSIIPEGSLVANEPNDGSAYAYGADGLRTCYRYWSGYDSPNEEEKPESVLVRERLCDIASDEDVKAAVESIGVEYVLQLEQGERSWNTSMWVYGDGKFWRGIDGIDEDTRGFECILSRDDMSLYKIVA